MSYSPELQQLLELEIPVSPPTEIGFLEITETQSSELINSRLYAYFLNPDRNPKVAELFLESLLEIINIKSKGFKQLTFQNYTCEVEVSLDSRRRIDILIKTKDQNPTQAIIIENKIYDQNNDPIKFKEYYNIIDTADLNKVGIYLTLDKRNPSHSDFINITHGEWMDAIKKRGIPPGLDLKEYVYLNDFFSSISNLTMNDQFNENVEFYFKHLEIVNRADEVKKAAKNYILTQLTKAAQQVNCNIGDYFETNRSFYHNLNPNLYYTLYFGNLFSKNPGIVIAVGIQKQLMVKKEHFINLLNNHPLKINTSQSLEENSNYIIYKLFDLNLNFEELSNLSNIITYNIVDKLFNILEFLNINLDKSST